MSWHWQEVGLKSQREYLAERSHCVVREYYTLAVTRSRSQVSQRIPHREKPLHSGGIL